jgi:hypothetical protein
MKQEIEMALRLLEKDIHEKQDTVVSLRKQLEEIKEINLEMYNKLQVRMNSSLQDKNFLPFEFNHGSQHLAKLRQRANSF